MDPTQNHGLGWGPSIALEHNLADFETFTNERSCLPIFGTVFAVVKLALGIIQVLGGLVVALAAGALSLCGIENAKETSQRGVSHLVNGMANIGASIVQATWIGGIILDQGARQFPSREQRHLNKKTCWGATGQEILFVGYKVLYDYPNYFVHVDPSFPQDPRTQTLKPCAHPTTRHLITSTERPHLDPHDVDEENYTKHRPWVLV